MEKLVSSIVKRLLTRSPCVVRAIRVVLRRLSVEAEIRSIYLLFALIGTAGWRAPLWLTVRSHPVNTRRVDLRAVQEGSGYLEFDLENLADIETQQERSHRSRLPILPGRLPFSRTKVWEGRLRGTSLLAVIAVNSSNTPDLWRTFLSDKELQRRRSRARPST